MFKISLFAVFAILYLSGVNSKGLKEEFKPNFSQHPDLGLNITQLINKYGYEVEVHEIISGDGYILQALRIPHGRLSPPGPNKPVIWLQHGLLGSCADWFYNGEDQNLPYILADSGFDVWLGNARGNKFSNKHITLDPNEEEYWKFSWHEMGVYDVPAMIDYSLEKTGQEQVYYIGHSMGTTIFFIGMATHPDYNAKIKAMFAFAPAIYLENIVSPLKYLAPMANEIEKLLVLLGSKGEFLQSFELAKLVGYTLCSEMSPVAELCANFIFLIAGVSDQMNITQIPLLLQHLPAGTSSRAVIHYAQSINNKDFKLFNWGQEENLKRYGLDLPTSYRLDQITAPISIHWGDNDWLCVPKDVERFKNVLPNVIDYHHIPIFNHMDFVYAAKDVYELLYYKVMETLETFESKNK